MRITVENPFPAASETGDPSADDDEFQAIFEDSWDEAVRRLGLNPDDFLEIRNEEILLVCILFVWPICIDTNAC